MNHILFVTIWLVFNLISCKIKDIIYGSKILFVNWQNFVNSSQTLLTIYCIMHNVDHSKCNLPMDEHKDQWWIHMMLAQSCPHACEVVQMTTLSYCLLMCLGVESIHFTRDCLWSKLTYTVMYCWHDSKIQWKDPTAQYLYTWVVLQFLWSECLGMHGSENYPPSQVSKMPH